MTPKSAGNFFVPAFLLLTIEKATWYNVVDQNTQNTIWLAIHVEYSIIFKIIRINTCTVSEVIIA